MSSNNTEEWKKRAEEKRKLRAQNLRVNRPDSNFFLKLDANVKKNGQLVKRIRTLHELSKDIKKNIVVDLEKQNLRRYVDEILSALSNLPLNADTSPYILNILAHFYQRYCDLKEFFPNLVKSCVHQDSSKGLDLIRFSAALNLVAGCVEIAICPVDTILNMLKGMIAKTQEKKPKACLSVVLNFLEQFGDVFLDIPPSKMKDILRASYTENGIEFNEENLNECEYKAFVSAEERIVSSSEMQQFYNILNPFFQFLCTKLVSEHESMSQMEKEKHDKLSGIRLSETPTDAVSSFDTYSNKRKKWDKIFKGTKILGMYINQQIPDRVLEGTHRIQAMENEQHKEKGYINMVRAPFDDDELPFYTIIPPLEPESIEVTGNIPNSSAGATLDSDADELVFSMLPTLTQSQVLPFCNKYFSKFGHSKSGKKKLAKHLFAVKRTSLELLPLYAKVVKILEPEGGELSDQLTSMLRKEFEKLFTERDQIKIESKVKNMRFMCELVKFKIMDPHIILSSLKQCLNEFRHHNIDVACACIESCGRFLMASEDESISSVIKQLVDKMWRLKSVKTLEEKYETMVENAYFSLFTSSDSHSSSVIGMLGNSADPLLLYVRHLLLHLDLGQGEKMDMKYKNIVKQLRKLPYNSQADLPEKIANIVMVLDSKYEDLAALAYIISELGRYRQRILVLIIDSLLERIRWNLAEGDYFSRQQGIKDIKFLGELYNCRAIDLNVLEDVWYMCISYARWNNDTQYECYRIQLICESLLTVFKSIVESNDKKRLDRFLLYFQRYVLGKGVRLPVNVEFLLADTLDAVRPKLFWPRSFAEACKRVKTIEQRRKIQWPGEFMPSTTNDIAELGAFDQNGKWMLKERSEKLWPIEPEKFRNYTMENTNEDHDAESSSDSEEDINSVNHLKQMGQQLLNEEAARKRKQRLEEMVFEKEFQQMVNESVNERKKERPIIGTKLLRVDEIVKNLHLATRNDIFSSEAPSKIAKEHNDENNDSADHSAERVAGVKMFVIMRKGKQKVREMEVPVDSSLASKTLDPKHQAIEQEKKDEEEAKKHILMNMKNRR
jgi:hypothetical protein